MTLEKKASSLDFGSCGVSPSSVENPADGGARAAIHHPDKISATEEPGISDAYFVQLRLAQDTLLKPAQRFAYDRFGPTVLAWEHCSSIRDYVTAAFTSAAPGYIGTAIITVMFGVIGVIRGGSFVCSIPVLPLLLHQLMTNAVAILHWGSTYLA